MSNIFVTHGKCTVKPRFVFGFEDKQTLNKLFEITINFYRLAMFRIFLHYVFILQSIFTSVL